MKNMIMAVFIIILMAGTLNNVFAAEIGNTVWNDQNKNGIQDPGEEGISGVKIKLYNGNDVETDKTNSQGRYKFKDLDDGHYTIVVAQETLPNGCYATYDRDGNKDGIYEDKYVSGDDYYTHADFGYYCPQTYSVSSINKVSPNTGSGTIALVIATITALFVAGIVFLQQKKVFNA